MSDALFLVAMLAILFLVGWVIQNDRGEPDSGYKGLFALRRKDTGPQEDAPPQADRPRWRRGR